MRDTFKNIYLGFVVSLTFFTCADKDESDQGAAGESYRSFTADGAWCWFSDPRAIYFEGTYKRTYSGWVDSLGNIVVGSYDYADGKIRTKILHERFERDDHDNPSFFMDSQGKLMVFYSRHGTRNSPIFLARSKNSEDISQWEPVRKLRLNDTIAYAGLSNSYTYTNIVQLSEEKNKLYLFWRGADFKPNFSVSIDSGKNWDQGKILILPERIYKNRRPYMKVASNNRDVIHFAFTDGHPNAEPTNSIYYAKYQGGALHKANGEKIMDWSFLPLDPKQSDVVYNAAQSREKAWIWDVAENKAGNPVIVYSQFPSDSNHVYYYSIYDEGRWNNYRLHDSGPWFPHTLAGATEREPNYSGGIVLDHEDPSNVYLSREKNGVFELEKWTTDDSGKNWKVTVITKDSEFDNVRPFVVRNHADDSGIVLWMNIKKYLHYTDYQGEIKILVRHPRVVPVR
ncbi:MAG: BNR-4 repeat-containing protein [Cyclobacteriaceae bacterium]